MTQSSSHSGMAPAVPPPGPALHPEARTLHTRPEVTRYVDWGAILAGAVFAASLSFILISFGGAVGLSLASPFAGEGIGSAWLAIAAGIWFVWVVVTSLGAGGYLAGRMRHRADDANADEIEARDGTHGLMVWATSVLAALVLAATGAGGMVAAGGAVAGPAVQAAADMGAEQVDYYADLLLRAEAAGPGAGAMAGARAGTDPAVQSRVAAVLRHGILSGEFQERDRSYLAEMVAQRTGIDPAEGRQRVDGAIAEIDAARQAAVEAVDRARIIGVITGFLVAASLLIGAAVAYFTAALGGRHRDEGLFFGGRIAAR